MQLEKRRLAAQAAKQAAPAVQQAATGGTAGSTEGQHAVREDGQPRPPKRKKKTKAEARAEAAAAGVGIFMCFWGSVDVFLGYRRNPGLCKDHPVC